jgi:hypothetical protein
MMKKEDLKVGLIIQVKEGEDLGPREITGIGKTKYFFIYENQENPEEYFDSFSMLKYFKIK